jgi:hypothetical protein
MNITDLINEYLKDKQRDLENDCFNIVDNKIFSWNFTYVPQPTQEELEALASSVEADHLQEAINAESEAYLASTDWLIVREMETGIQCPIEVKIARSQARLQIVR